MLPESDPYATKSARKIDLALVLFALAMIAMVIVTSPRKWTGTGNGPSPAARQLEQKAATTAAPPGSPILLAASGGQNAP